MSDLTRGLAALEMHDDCYATAEDYYNGDVAERFASTRLARRLIASGMETRFNFACTPVDSRAERLEIAAIGSADAAANARILELWDANQLGLEAPITMRKVLMHGDGYLLVWPGDAEGDPAPVAEATPRTGTARQAQLLQEGLNPPAEGGDPLKDAEAASEAGTVFMYYKSPREMRLFYDPENPLLKSYAIDRWETNDGTRADLYYPDRIEKFLLPKQADAAREENWLEWTDEEGDEWPYANPFGDIPVFHFRTDRPYGKPVHARGYGPQDAITKLIVSHLSTVDYQAGPQRYAMLEAGTDTDEAEATSFNFDADDVAPDGAPGEGTSTYRSHPGSLWEMKGVKGVGQFDPANPAIFTDPMLTYLRMMAELTTTPIDKIDPTGSVESGESRRAREASFVKAVRMLQMSFGTTWREAFEFALWVSYVLWGGQPSFGSARVDVRWAPAASNDDKDSWEVADTKIKAGVPRYQVYLEQGYTADQIEAWGVKPDETSAAPNGGTE